LEQDARHWAFLNSVGLQAETVHSLMQRDASTDGGGGSDDDSLLGARPASLAELVDVVEYLLQSGYGRNKDIITGLRTFFTRNDTARFLASLGVRDVGRTLVRFPQLLRYDVATVLQPRATFLSEQLGVADVGLAISRHPMLLIYRYAPLPSVGWRGRRAGQLARPACDEARAAWLTPRARAQVGHEGAAIGDILA
jgi:hypothetical protein